MKVLLIVNEDPVSVDVVRGVLSLTSDGENMHVRVLFPIALRDRPDSGQLHMEWLSNRAAVVVEKVADVFRARGLTTEESVCFGNSSSSIIINEAQRFEADWIVLGLRLDEVVEGWPADTTAQYVSNHAPCSVKVVPLESWHGTL